MNILFDTNVLFSALGFQGVPGKLLEEMARCNHTLVTSDFILEELQEKIKEKFTGSQKEAALDLLFFILSKMQVEVKKKPHYQGTLTHGEGLVPEQDTPILAVALLDDVDYLVSGDKHFTKNKNVDALEKVKVVTPREIVELLAGHSAGS